MVELKGKALSDAFDHLKEVVRLSLSKNEQVVINVMNALLDEEALAISYIKEGRPIISGILVVADDKVACTRDLLIYAVASFGKTERADWDLCLSWIKEKAIDSGCGRLVAYSDNRFIIQLVQSWGWNVETRVLRTEV